MKKITHSNVYWYSLKNPGTPNILSGKIKTKYAVIGGGMAGLSCAQKLQELGQETIIIEKEFCGSGASGKTSGFITPDSEIELSSLLETYGADKTKRIWEFVLSGVELIRRNIKNHKILCDFEIQDSLFIANNKLGFNHIKKEHSAREKLGYESKLYDGTNIEDVIGSKRYCGAVRYPDTFGLNSYLYCQAMKEMLIKSGVLIFENTPAISINGNEIITPHGCITADHIIVCADRYIPELGVLKKEIYHVQTFLGITKPLSDQQIKSMFPEGPLMVWDTDVVYNYFRLTSDKRLLIGGGDLLYTYAHNILQDTKRYGRRLQSYIHKKFPLLDFEIEYLWPGMLGVSKDLLPIIGPDENNGAVFYVGAASGLPWAAALGTYAAERLILDRHEFDDDFSLNRHFIIGSKMQSVIGDPATYAVSHGIAKYL